MKIEERQLVPLRDSYTMEKGMLIKIPVAKISHIFIFPAHDFPGHEVSKATLLAARGLEGDRYSRGAGSYSKDTPGKRQITLMSLESFASTGFDLMWPRRNLIVECYPSFEILELITKEFWIGRSLLKLKGEKYCTVCGRPSTLAQTEVQFNETFRERGGIIAQVFEGGEIAVGDEIFIEKEVNDH